MIKNIRIAIDSILANKFRALLTTLGIIFGVAAVIAMLAVGNGAQQKVLEQLKIVGVNNLIVQSVFEEKSEIEEKEQKKETEKFSPGLSIKDLNNILKVVPNIENYAIEVGEENYAISKNNRVKTKMIGVNKSYFKLFNLTTERGSFFNSFHNKKNKNVCVLGNKISKELFPKTDPIGKTIRVGSINLKVIGIIKNLSGVGTELKEMGINDYNKEIYIPINTFLLKVKNRELISIGGGKEINKNQLDKIAIQVKNTDELTNIGKVVFNIINRRHNKINDFKLIIPEQILKQKKETNDLFNLLLGAIASISLLVGGIGIMNIMLASVMERIKEIGLRMAIGATKKDIKLQFVFEALFISLFGGFLGIFLGIGISYLIEFFLKMPIKISIFSVLISFLISVLTGILFGYLPAKKASEQNPVNSLKYE